LGSRLEADLLSSWRESLTTSTLFALLALLHLSQMSNLLLGGHLRGAFWSRNGLHGNVE
jgi:hypothetical protein